MFYWAANGTTAWHTETVAGAGSTFNWPAMAVNGNSVNIVAQGPDNSLLFYWATNGTIDLAQGDRRQARTSPYHAVDRDQRQHGEHRGRRPAQHADVLLGLRRHRPPGTPRPSAARTAPPPPRRWRSNSSTLLHRRLPKNSGFLAGLLGRSSARASGRSPATSAQHLFAYFPAINGSRHCRRQPPNRRARSTSTRLPGARPPGTPRPWLEAREGPSSSRCRSRGEPRHASPSPPRAGPAGRQSQTAVLLGRSAWLVHLAPSAVAQLGQQHPRRRRSRPTATPPTSPISLPRAT